MTNDYLIILLVYFDMNVRTVLTGFNGLIGALQIIR